jgi:glycyl-tRNA synthetase
MAQETDTSTMPDAESPSSAGAARYSMDDLVALCKRCAFIFPASEIYGGINGFWDFGPRGVALKNNLRDRWWRDMVECPPMGTPGLTDGGPLSIVGVDTAIIQNPKVWEASGHVGGFNDPMRKCTRCGHLIRADQLWDTLVTWSVWFNSMIQEFKPAPVPTKYPSLDSGHLIKWARTSGKRLAPNLALVRNPEVTLTWLATRINGQPDAPPDVIEIARYVATEQLHATGLQDPCPKCGGELGQAEPFKLMFETWAGLTQTDDNRVFLRPETAQGIFTNFRNIVDTMRVKVPFGIAQVGKSFRNELTPRNFIFRAREFEQMEMEWFCHPDSAREWYDYWVEQRLTWWKSVGLTSANLQRRDHEADELAHYSTACADVEYRYPFSGPGFNELEGIAHRGCFDLDAHQKASGAKLEYFDQDLQVKLQAEGKSKDEINARARYLPHVIEPAAGLTRGVLALLCEAYTPDPGRPSTVYMKFHPAMAPIKAGVFPLVNKDGMPEIAANLHERLRRRYACQYDAKQSIGKRYARMDEAGTPYSFTIDGDTLTDQTVTVRDRDTASQERIGIDRVEAYLAERIG